MSTELCPFVFLMTWIPFKPIVIVAGLLTVLLASDQICAQVTSSFTEPFSTSEIAAAESGIITKTHVQEGDKVSKNQLLASLNKEVLQQKLRIAKHRAKSDAKIRLTKATVELKRKNYETLKPLLESGHANPAEVKQAEAELNAAIAEWQIAREKMAEQQIEVQQMEAQLNQRDIRSPVNGIITEIHRKAGESITSSEQGFATIVELDSLRARFYLLSSVVRKLKKGMNVHVRLGKQQIIEAEIGFISPVIDPKSGTARVDVLIENKSGRLRSGTDCHWIGPKSRRTGTILSGHSGK